MPTEGLDKLWELHLVDKAIAEIRARAAALDPGRRLAAEIKAAKVEHDRVHEHAHALSGELADFELKQKGIDDKVKRLDKDLYGGKIVNPREVENVQREIEALKRQRGEIDLKILGLWEELPQARERAEQAKACLSSKQAELAAHQRQVSAERARLEAEFKERSARRQGLAAQIENPLLARYDGIRQKQGGLGMSKLLKDGACELCGMSQPRKTIELCKEGSFVTCESCYRILYYSESVR